MQMITLYVFAGALVCLVTTVNSKAKTTAFFSDEIEQRILTHTYRSLLQDAFSDLFDWNQNIDVLFRNTDYSHRIGSRVLHKVGKLCPPGSLFASMDPGHMEAVMILKSLITNEGTAMKAISLAAFLRQRQEVHPHAWVRAIYAASISRSDLQGLFKPSIWNVIPGYFFPAPVLRRLHSRRWQNGRSGDADDCEKVSGHDGINNGVENTLWYFREDVAVNSHHFNWHIWYPFDEDHKAERSGELFYFVHHEMLARYKTERISNRMLPVQRFQMLPDEEFPHHYYPNLLENYSIKWTDRTAEARVVDVFADTLVNASERNEYKQRLMADIMQMILTDKNGVKVSLNDRDGINKIGSTLEASKYYSTNPALYMARGIHNTGHLLAGKVMNPNSKSGDPVGVMYESSVAMRDPLFYAIHEDIDEVMKLHKNLLNSYSSLGGLENGEILLQSLRIQTPGQSPNTLNTFWNHAKFDLTRGLDFNVTLPNPVTICQYHLDHLDFDYEFDIVSEFADVTPVTIRIFMHPLFDHQDIRFTINEEREHAFTMDLIKLDLQPGQNTFRHSSLLSQVTAPRLQHYEHGDDGNTPHCGCGWPHHMLIPKGRAESEGGLKLGLFAIVTPIEISLERGRQSAREECEKSYVYCGDKGHSYPDSFPMGYPFDRKFDIDDGTTQELAEKVSNAAFAKITVYHEGSDLVTED